MLIDTLRQIFRRDLDKLAEEISQYKDEKNIWIVEKEISNCGGNLCLHLVGNLNAFIGAGLGNTGYVRRRDLEFSQKDVPRAELIQAVKNTKEMVDKALSELTPEDLEKDFPIVVFKGKMSTLFFLVHLSTHLAYHLGQVNYHRRLLD